MLYLRKVHMEPLHFLQQIVPVCLGPRRLWIWASKCERQLVAQSCDDAS